jgi:hypothetical protein
MISTSYQPTINRESRTPVRLPDRSAVNLFPGWGPKF